MYFFIFASCGAVNGCSLFVVVFQAITSSILAIGVIIDVLSDILYEFQINISLHVGLMLGLNSLSRCFDEKCLKVARYMKHRTQVVLHCQNWRATGSETELGNENIRSLQITLLHTLTARWLPLQLHIFNHHIIYIMYQTLFQYHTSKQTSIKITT